MNSSTSKACFSDTSGEKTRFVVPRKPQEAP